MLMAGQLFDEDGSRQTVQYLNGFELLRQDVLDHYRARTRIT